MTDPAHPFSEEELLSFVRGQAAPDLKARIEAIRKSAPSFDAELTLMENLKPALAGIEAPNPPGELDWRRLQADIRRDVQRTNVSPSSANVNSRLKIWQIAAVFLGCAVLGQAAYIGWNGTRPADGYIPASQSTVGYVLAIQFEPTATAAEIDALLQNVQARIIDGPGASGIYRLSFASSAAQVEARPSLESAEIVKLLAEE